MNVRYETKAWMPPMVIRPRCDLRAAIANDETQRQRGDDLHGGEEERREPGRPIRGLVHFGRQLLKLFCVLVFTQQCLDHAYTLEVFVERAGDL